MERLDVHVVFKTTNLILFSPLQFQASGGNALTPSDEPTREKLKRFVAYRQDLERVRNLCYMISRREKFKKSMVKYREQILEKQLMLVSEDNNVQHM